MFTRRSFAHVEQQLCTFLATCTDPPRAVECLPQVPLRPRMGPCPQICLLRKSCLFQFANSTCTVVQMWYSTLSTLSTQTCEAHVSQKFWKLVLSYSKEEQHCQALMPLKHCEVRLCSQSTRPRGDCTGKAKCVCHCLIVIMSLSLYFLNFRYLFSIVFLVLLVSDCICICFLDPLSIALLAVQLFHICNHEPPHL